MPLKKGHTTDGRFEMINISQSQVIVYLTKVIFQNKNPNQKYF